MFDENEDKYKIKVLNANNKKNIVHRVEEGETIESIARLYNQTKDSLMKINNIKVVEEGDRLVIPQKNTAIYVVKPLDTLVKIASKYNVSVEEIVKNNNSSKIFIGQVLII
ncbi:MAG: LysM peptidoglycan-binding domain-containing protein [Clostridia bacterium]|nr:LysM peptidoglycan-binding domain-containing protein [Clostridia bacterium]